MLNKKALKILPELFVVVIFIGILISYCEIRLRDVPNHYTIKKNNLEKQLGSEEILILGSSQSLNGIDPKYFSVKGYNLAEESQSLYYDKELLLKYINRMPSLKIVFISVSYLSLWFEVYGAVESWRDYYYYKFWDIKSNNPDESWLKKLSYIALYGTSFSQNAFRKNFKIGLVKNPDEYGWYNPADINLSQAPQTLMQLPVTDTSVTHNSQMKDEFFERNVAYLDTLLAELAIRNIPAVIITPPVYKIYSAHTDPAKNKIMHDVIKSMCDKYICRYYDFFNDTRFLIEDFYDDNHMNPRGAIKFSNILNNEIIKNMLVQQPGK